MTVEDRVAAFLRNHKGTDFCDDCTASQVGINRHQARNATSGLGASRAAFSRGDRTCSRCGKDKRVIRAL